MLPKYLVIFNDTLERFNSKFPRQKWTEEFKDNLINDYSFFSARVEDNKLKYGDTIQFLNNESVKGIPNLNSLLGITEHQQILKKLIDSLNGLNAFALSEELIKKLHGALMESPYAWEADFKPELVGNYRNVPAVGSRLPYFDNKEYIAHFNLEVVMPSHVDIFNNKFLNIDNSTYETHLLTIVAYFHNKFLNYLHPFADGNGRVCRIIMGALLMSNNCPPIFPQITDQDKQVEYITKIVDCEINNTDAILVEYFAKGMTEYLLNRLK